VGASGTTAGSGGAIQIISGNGGAAGGGTGGVAGAITINVGSTVAGTAPTITIGAAASNTIIGNASGVTTIGPRVGSSTKNRGTITLSSGTGTATVISGAICVCTDTAATPVILRCNVSATTLTASEAAGTSTHVIAYLCD
jgi:hypothetical protein